MKMEISLFHLDDIIISKNLLQIDIRIFINLQWFSFAQHINATCVYNLENVDFWNMNMNIDIKNAASFCVISNIDIIVALVCIFRHYRWALGTEQINHYMKDRRNLRIRSYYTLVFRKSFFTSIYFLQQVDKNA